MEKSLKMESIQAAKEYHNRYIEELKKCVGENVTVYKNDGRQFEGICKAISFQHLNVVLMTPIEKIVIKDISHIVRTRSFDKKGKF